MSQAAPLVTIVTPTLNGAAFLEDAITSVLALDGSPVEYLVMDGGSGDGTLGLLNRFEGRLQWRTGPDAGQAAAIADGFARGSGAILAWLNADDVYEPGAVREAAEFLAAHPEVDVVYGNAEFIDGEGRRLGPCTHVEPFDAKRLLTMGDFISQPAAFFRRSAYDAVGGLDVTLQYAFDYDLWLRLTAKGHGFAHVDRMWARVRLHDATKTARGGGERLQEIARIVKRQGGTGLPAAFLLEAAVVLSRAAGDALRGGRLREAARTLPRALYYRCAHTARRLWFGARLAR